MSTQVEIDEKLYNDIKVYCSLNALKIKAFVNELLKKAFIIEKYGETPFSSPQLHNDEQNIAEEKQESNKIQIIQLQQLLSFPPKKPKPLEPQPQPRPPP